MKLELYKFVIKYPNEFELMLIIDCKDLAIFLLLKFIQVFDVIHWSHIKPL